MVEVQWCIWVPHIMQILFCCLLRVQVTDSWCFLPVDINSHLKSASGDHQNILTLASWLLILQAYIALRALWFPVLYLRLCCFLSNNYSIKQWSSNLYSCIFESVGKSLPQQNRWGLLWRRDGESQLQWICGHVFSPQWDGSQRTQGHICLQNIR